MAKRVIGIALSMAMLAMASCTPPEGRTVQIHFGGSSPGAVMFYMVGAFSTVVTPLVPGVNITNVTTGAAFDNAIQVARGELDLGLTQDMIVQQLLSNTGAFADPQWHGVGDDLMAVAWTHSNDFYFVAFRDSGIQSIEDLNGRIVSTGPPGSGVQFIANMVLDALNLDLERQHLAFADTVFAMREGRIDAVAMTGSPAGAITELAETEDIIIIPFTYEQINLLVEVNPLFFPDYLPPIYRGMVGPTLLPHFKIIMVAHRSVPDQIIYDILNAAFQPSSLEAMTLMHPNWANFVGDIQSARDNNIPVHPGALRFFQENPWAPRQS
ncbi:MAG: TAXI family TRAP transporter solute-binding subunit [Treponema sp.]|nr:TAXI family TRAP transporter solute-binding subunit [Treponema sp.]